MTKFGPIALVGAGILLLPVILPVTMIQHTLDTRRRRRIAEVTPCGRCGELLGYAAVLESNNIHRKEFERMREMFPGVKFRIVRPHDAVCVKCGQEHLYAEQTKAYTAVNTSEAEAWTIVHGRATGGSRA